MSAEPKRQWLPPAAYRDWRRKQESQARGDRQMQESIARIYAEHNGGPVAETITRIQIRVE